MPVSLDGDVCGSSGQFPKSPLSTHRRTEGDTEALCSRKSLEMGRQEQWADGLLWQDPRGLQTSDVSDCEVGHTA